MCFSHPGLPNITLGSAFSTAFFKTVDHTQFGVSCACKWQVWISQTQQSLLVKGQGRFRILLYVCLLTMVQLWVNSLFFKLPCVFPTVESYKGIGVGAPNTKLILVEHPHAILCTIFKLHLGCCFCVHLKLTGGCSY